VTSTWQQTLQWLIDEGTRVEAGDSVGRLDPGSTESELRDTDDQLTAKQQEREAQRAEARIERMRLELEVKRAEIEHRKVGLDADVPQDVLGGKDYRERQLELSKAEQALDDARLALVEHDASTRSSQAETDIEIAELRERHARLERELESLNLRATKAGIVVHEIHPWFGRKVRIGDRLQTTTPVARIPDLSTLEVEAWAGEIDATRIDEGRPVELRLDAYPDRVFHGRVISVASAGERRETWGRAPYLRIRISIDDGADSTMKPGMSVRCEIEAG
jgi:multidrug resistance efflux pump